MRRPGPGRPSRPSRATPRSLVPLVVGQTPFGLITCYTAEKHQFSAREIILMESMANQAGLAIETARRLAEAQQSFDRAPPRPPRCGPTSRAAARRREPQRAVAVVLRGGGLSAIAESLGTMLRCTVAIDDAAGRLLASAGDGRRSGSQDRRVAAAYEQARQRLGEKLDLETVVIPSALGQPGRGWSSPSSWTRRAAGYLWALQPRTPFGPPQRQALTRAAAVVALGLLRERTAQEVEWRLPRATSTTCWTPRASPPRPCSIVPASWART